MMTFHPDLTIGRFIPPITIGPRLARLASRPRPDTAPDGPLDLLVEDVDVPPTATSPGARIRLYRPRTAKGPVPALLWVHGGGMVLGDHLQDATANMTVARALGITVASVRYRLSPAHPAPAALEDVYAALEWLHDNAAARQIDPARIAIGGASAGAGLAAGVTLMAHDRGMIPLAFQLLAYPMIDDRTATRSDIDTRHVRAWTPRSNRFGWKSYLGHEPGTGDVSPYAAPARRDDLTGLPSAWIGVGSLDLFLDEDRRYAERLSASGVTTTLEIVPGAFHAFDLILPKKNVSKRFLHSQIDALDGAFFARA